MGVYGFRKQFVPFILSGEKTHTIRAIRAHPDKPGNMLHLYTGLRQKGCRLLMRVPCVKVEEIEISCRIKDLRGGGAARLIYAIAIGGVSLDNSEMEALARLDGFSNFQEMMKFWNGRLPFHGHIIHWKK